MGGLGIRMSKNIALPSFIISLQSVSSLVDSVLRNVRLGGDGGLQAAIEAWHEVNAVAVLSGNVDESRQRTWDVPQSEAAVVKLLDEADQISRARLLAAAKRERK